MRYLYPRHVTIAEKEKKAREERARLRKKNPDIRPVVLEGKTLATTWWGKSWNQNLERYADFENRIGRGRSYVRHGAVLDLQIEPGKVTSLVQGTAPRPYRVSVMIAPIEKKAWEKIKKACQGQIDTLPELLEGKFPRAMAELFTAKSEGLFPSSGEIKFDCSCPDWASMCKHVAATLYGIGARLDEDPLLFFTLRDADVNELITAAVEDHTQSLLQKAGIKSERALVGNDLGAMFGIDMDGEAAPAPDAIKEEKIAPDADKNAESKPTVKDKAKGKTAAKKTKKAAGAKTDVSKKMKTSPRAKSRAKGKVKAGGGKTAPNPSAKKAPMTDTEIVLDLVSRSRKGTNIATLEKKTRIEHQKISGILDGLEKQGKVQTLKKGMYTAVR